MLRFLLALIGALLVVNLALIIATLLMIHAALVSLDHDFARLLVGLLGG